MSKFTPVSKDEYRLGLETVFEGLKKLSSLTCVFSAMHPNVNPDDIVLGKKMSIRGEPGEEVIASRSVVVDGVHHNIGFERDYNNNGWNAPRDLKDKFGIVYVMRDLRLKGTLLPATTSTFRVATVYSTYNSPAPETFNEFAARLVNLFNRDHRHAFEKFYADKQALGQKLTTLYR